MARRRNPEDGFSLLAVCSLESLLTMRTLPPAACTFEPIFNRNLRSGGVGARILLEGHFEADWMKPGPG